VGKDIVITMDQVAQFGASCGDRNPLHLDTDYGHTTPFGQTVVHGTLAAIACLARLAAAPLAGMRELHMDFHQPVMPGTMYRLHLETDEQQTAVRLRLGDMPVLSVVGSDQISVLDDRALEPVRNADEPEASLPECWRSTARVLDPETLAGVGLEEGSYRIDGCRMRALLKQLGAEAVPFHLVKVLSWASYWTGMHTPGRDALLARVAVRLNRTSGSAPYADSDHALYQVERPSIHRRTGLVSLDAGLQLSGWAVNIAIDSLLRRCAPQATCESGAQYLSPSNRLADKFMVVVGGSRGLGRAITLALVQQGATVLVIHCQSPERVAEMQRNAGPNGHRILSLMRDASDIEALVAALNAQATSIDALILAAAPVIPSLPLHHSTIGPCLRYVDQAVRLVWAPLAASVNWMKVGSALVVLSSSAVEEPPALWPHYVSAKMAIEGLARHAAKQWPWHVAIVRPPRLWREMSSGPTGAIGTIPVELVAAHIASQLVAYQANNGIPSLVHQTTMLSARDVALPVSTLNSRDEQYAAR